MSNHIVEIDLAEGPDSWNNEVLQCPVPVIVDFHAEWCGPCKQLTPKIKEHFNNSKSFKLVKVNVDDCSEVAEQMEISGIPAVFLFINGKQVMNFVGNNLEELEKMVNATKG